ncbi:MAG: prolyl-tRNA synthetase [Sulfurovum sp. FS08-3]|nr:MAG: prolyl-tRNA synthetase [Sulfurovum sp. FS08-3]
MKFSQTFIPTTKETPAEATLPSHQFLIQAGFINQEGAGLYNFMPLGKRVLDKIRAIVKEELDRAGCLEVQLGFVTPLELWEESGRATKMGLEMLRIKDRKQNDYVLSPTNEEAMVKLVKNRITSYKDLPINLYQIHTKFRDEARPRFGLLRGREFLMKDGYSFHDSTEDMQREFALMEATYRAIFTRLGLEFRVVDADSGAIGGSGSKEFHVLAKSGEDTLVVCDGCDYAANIEAASRGAKQYDKQALERRKVETPNCTTIEEVSKFLHIEAHQTIKAVIKKAIYETQTQIVIFFVRGNDELEETKACNAVNALELVDATQGEIEAVGLQAGYVGIEGLPHGTLFKIDKELYHETNRVCGANEVNYHLMGVDMPNDETLYADLIAVQEGDGCSCCGGTLSHTKGIEVGHIFQLGTKYSSAMKAEFLDANGKSQPFVMGTYGIGVSRLVAAIIEQHHDEKGCIWSKESAPYDLHIIISNAKKAQELEAGERIYEAFKEVGIQVLLDDRAKERFGFKMNDFELIGIPYAIVVGKKLEQGIVEIIERKSLTSIEVSLDSVVSTMLEKLG